jgi:hypothetical protein
MGRYLSEESTLGKAEGRRKTEEQVFQVRKCAA